MIIILAAVLSLSILIALLTFFDLMVIALIVKAKNFNIFKSNLILRKKRTIKKIRRLCRFR